MLHTHLKNFKKKKEFLVCIDSDGTAMDVMNIKHKRCFGPCLVKEWKLEKYSGEALALWNDINLYKKTRGNNRFLTLYAALCEIDRKYEKIFGIEDLKRWLDTTDSLSNQSLLAAAEETGSEMLKKALAWSQAVNAETALLTYDDKQPFKGVKEFLEEAVKYVDIAIVSSAGYAIIKEEWQYHGLLQYVSVITSQEDGSKKKCLDLLVGKGYRKERVLMLGDALSDMKAAHESGVLFYPIRVDEEKESWELLGKRYLRELIEGTYLTSQPLLESEFNRYFEK